MQTETMTLRELTVRYSAKTDGDGHAVVVGRVLSKPTDAATTLMTLLQDEPSEVFAILCLTTKLRVIAYHEVSRGTLNAVLAEPREVFRAAILANGAFVVLAHCHPSGEPSPSPDDIAVTKRLVAAGEVLGIPVLDHLIIGDRRYFSFKDAGHL